jgi:hypothetical protein
MTPLPGVRPLTVPKPPERGEDLKTVVGERLEAVNQAHVQRAVQRGRAGDDQLVMLPAGRQPTYLDGQPAEGSLRVTAHDGDRSRRTARTDFRRVDN